MLTLIVVDDQLPVLQALLQCFALEPDISIVGKAASGAEALTLAEKLHPDVVLLDFMMPGTDGIATTLALRQLVPATKVVLLSIHDNIATRTKALQAGASAFVAKHDPAETLLAAVRQAALAPS